MRNRKTWSGRGKAPWKFICHLISFWNFFYFFWSRLRNSIAECNHFMLYFLQDQRGAGFTKIYICGFFFKNPSGVEGVKARENELGNFLQIVANFFLFFCINFIVTFAIYTMVLSKGVSSSSRPCDESSFLRFLI